MSAQPATRRTVIALAAAAIALPALGRAAGVRVEVAKSPTCGCCSAWVAHMRAEGFDVAVRDVPQDLLNQIKARAGVSPDVASCHTAAVEGYVVEGHVPAADVRRLLAERPAARGLSVPGMPVGSPGMEMGAARDPYDVILIGLDGATSVFSSYR